MSQTAKFEETLRRLAMIDEGFVEDDVGLGIDPAATLALESQDRGAVAGGGVGGGRVAGGVPGMEHRPGAGGGREPG